MPPGRRNTMTAFAYIWLAVAIVMGIIEVDEKWWNNPEKVSEVWTPYFEEVKHYGGVVRYMFDK